MLAAACLLAGWLADKQRPTHRPIRPRTAGQCYVRGINQSITVRQAFFSWMRSERIRDVSLSPSCIASSAWGGDGPGGQVVCGCPGQGARRRYARARVPHRPRGTGCAHAARARAHLLLVLGELGRPRRVARLVLGDLQVDMIAHGRPDLRVARRLAGHRRVAVLLVAVCGWSGGRGVMRTSMGQ